MRSTRIVASALVAAAALAGCGGDKEEAPASSGGGSSATDAPSKAADAPSTKAAAPSAAPTTEPGVTADSPPAPTTLAATKPFKTPDKLPATIAGHKRNDTTTTVMMAWYVPPEGVKTLQDHVRIFGLPVAAPPSSDPNTFKPSDSISCGPDLTASQPGRFECVINLVGGHYKVSGLTSKEKATTISKAVEAAV
jgi:hypothetical protein